MAGEWEVESTSPISSPAPTDGGDWQVESVTPTAPTAASFNEPLPNAPKAAPPVAPPQKRSLSQDISGGLASLYRGTGLGDEAAAGVDSLIHTGADLLSGRQKLDPSDLRGSLHQVRGAEYQDALARQRQMEADFAQAHPAGHGLLTGLGQGLTTVASMGDSLAPQAAGLAAPVLRTGLKAIPGAVARGVTTAGVSGAASAAADAGTVGERIQRAGQAARDPLTLGLGALSGGLGTPKAPKVKTPTGEELAGIVRDRAQGLYKSLDQMGANFRPQALQQLGRDIFGAVSPANRPGGVHPELSPKAYAVLHDQVMPFLTSGQPVGITALDELRQVVRNSTTGQGALPNDKRLGYAMLGKIDDFVRNANHSTIAMPIPMNAQGVPLPWQPGQSNAAAQQAATMLDQARNLWGRSAQIENITNRVTSATQRAATKDSGKNVANTIRQKLQPLIDPTRPNQMMRGLDPEAQAQLEKTIQPSFWEDRLREVGKMSPTRGGLHSLGAIGLAVSHPGSIPLMVGAEAARKAGDSYIHKNVDKLVGMIARGGGVGVLAGKQLQAMTASNPQIAAYVNALRQTAARGVGMSQGQNMATNPQPDSPPLGGF